MIHRCRVSLLVFIVAALLAVGSARGSDVAVSPFYAALAHCETHSSWHMRGSTYSGGLGWYNATWTELVARFHLRYPASPADATPTQEVHLAHLALTHRPRPLAWWGCLNREPFILSLPGE